MTRFWWHHLIISYRFSPTSVTNIVRWWFEKTVKAPIFESSDFFTPEFIEDNRALGIGREWFKNNRIGSDGFIQLSYQIAFRLIRNDPVSVYESCGTAAFKHGRTETIRPVTKESDDLILAYIKVSYTLFHIIWITSPDPTKTVIWMGGARFRVMWIRLYYRTFLLNNFIC